MIFLGYLSLQDNKVEELRILTAPFVAFAVMAYGSKQPGVEKWLSK